MTKPIFQSPNRNAWNRDFLFILAALCAVWFLFTSYIWVYFACLFISYPVGIMAAILWYFGKRRKNNPAYYKLVPLLLLVGLTFSLVVLAYLLVFE
jgi:hypothetical protein